MSAFARHQKLVDDYKRHFVTDADLLKSAHRFVHDGEVDSASTYEKRLAKRYYDQLFREFALADLTKFRKSMIGLRWRTQAEVFSGKGQFVCGSLHCDEQAGLRSYEVEFAYVEAGQSKTALVKVRVCSECAVKLHYRHFKRIAKKRKKSNRRRDDDDNDDGDDHDRGAERANDVEQRADALLAEVEAIIAAEAAQARARQPAATRDPQPAEFEGLF